MSRQFMAFPNFRIRALTLSYDDGTIFDKKLVEIMKKYGFKGTFNLNSCRFIEQSNPRILTQEEAIQLFSDDAFEVAIHGYKHRSLTNVEKSMVIDEIITDRRNLERIFGGIIKGMAYANGAVNDEVISLMKTCGITYARGVKSTLRFDLPNNWLNLEPTVHHNNPELMNLAEQFIAGTPWKSKDRVALFYLWGHSYEFDNNNNWEVIEKFAEYIGNREEVWYATNEEIYNYVKAYDSLEFSLEGDLVYNPSGIDVYLLCHNDEKYVVPAGQTVKIVLR